MQIPKTYRTFLTRACAVGMSVVLSAGAPYLSSVAQRKSKEKPPVVTGITSRKVANGEVISLSADRDLNGIQTWQDPNGSFHLILPGSGEHSITSSPNGVKVRRVGNSLEIEVRAKRGSSVTVTPQLNSLDLVVTGGVESSANSFGDEAIRPWTPSVRREAISRSTRATRNGPAMDRSASRKFANLVEAPVNLVTPVLPQGTASPVAPTFVTPAAPAFVAPVAQVNVPSAEPVPEASTSEDSELGVTESGFFQSGWWVTLLLIAVLAGLLMWRRRDKSGWEDVVEKRPATAVTQVDQEVINSVVGERRQVSRRSEERSGGQRSTDKKTARRVGTGFNQPIGQSLERRSTSVVSAPEELFGAYRVDQEVGKLVLGQAHRIDVLASRGADDRLAMEASLLKALRSTHTDEHGRRKARRALEEYGFVARRSATVLLAQDPCERVAAARFLGEVGLSSSLQFLLEALYDADSIVRNQAVESIGALKLPTAIGALLDIARRYPDVSTAALSRALNACSIECSDSFDSTSSQSALILNGSEQFSSEITQIEPSASYRELPASSDDANMVDSLSLLQSSDMGARISAAQSLALYRVQRVVTALRELTLSEAEPAVRATAIASLGAIDHESVFSAVLVALADEARDVRAAAARAVSRLSFNRADAYARVVEVSDEQELTDVAQACIKTGLASQALDRLTSDDRRQAYESFTLLTLLVKAGECQPILDVIEKHADVGVCRSVLQILSATDKPEVFMQLRQLADRNGMPNQLRTELIDVVSSFDQMQPA